MLTTDGRVQAARRRREGSRRRILEAAGILFARDGYGATSVEAIAAQAGVGPATVYNCFGNKGALASHLFRKEAAALAEAAREEMERDLPAPKAFRHHSARLQKMLEERRPLAAAMLTAIHETSLGGGRPDSPKDPRRVLPLPAPLTEILGYGQTRGEFRPEIDPALVAGTVTNVLAINFLNRRTLAENDQIIDLFLRGLESAEAGENSAQ